MSRLVARAENWERIYEAFNNINFAAFDYNTIKQSLLDYIKLYFPENFNDFIESSEFIAIIESFAYIAELIAYRLDVDAHENFISAAQRKESILRLAKLVSYSADRPLPARGLVKITSVSTTENVIDAIGNNLSNRTVRWNDASNPQWKDQFVLIINRVLEQTFGSVKSSDRFQLDNVLFELYTLNISPLASGIISYTAAVNGQNIPMELVPIEYDTKDGIIERRPYNNSNFSFLFGQDGLGDTSDTTGFFCYTKQGSLQRFRKTFDGITPNQTYELPQSNVNETDVWVNNVDPVTGATLDIPSLLPYRRDTTAGISGEWVQVDLAHAQNVIFNTNPKRNKYEIETRDGNRVRIVFGDGEFADVPSGTFDFWVRSSLDQDIIVPQSSVVNIPAKFSYVDTFGRTQTFSFTFSLINSLQNNSAAETLEHIRVTAPAVYYSQDRMVNGQDYNSFMLQDSSIIKLRSVNRTFAGDSKYINWHDPSTTYENVKMFTDDGAIYFQEKTETITTPAVASLNELITTYIEPLLSSTDIFIYVSSYGVSVTDFRRTFNQEEKTQLVSGLTPPPTPSNIQMYYNLATNSWFVIQASDNAATALSSYGWPNNFIPNPLISVVQQQNDNIYQVNRLAKRLICQSSTTSFWNTNNASRVIEYNTLNSDYDQIVVLQANPNHDRSGILQRNWNFNVLGIETIETGPYIGLPDVTRVSIIPMDENGDGVPDHLDINESNYHYGLADIIKPKMLVNLTNVADIPTQGVLVTLPIYYVIGQQDVHVENTNGAPAVLGTHWYEDTSSTTGVSNIIWLTHSSFANSLVKVTVNDYVYFARLDPADAWQLAPNTPDSMSSYLIELATNLGLWKRELGRSDLNIGWFHRSPRYYLIDPAASNIVDTFVIQKGYFLALKRWLEDPLATQPQAPTSLDLRLAYNYLIENKMISDSIVLHPGKIKLLFGSKAITPLQAVFKVVRSPDTSMTDNQIKTTIVTTVRNFFDITVWEFGETFYFTELATAIHAALPVEISTVVLIPISEQNHFGDLFQVQAREDEMFYPDITVDDIELVSDINATVLRMAQQVPCPTQQPNVFTQLRGEYAFNYNQDVITSSWTIVHELGYYPIVRVYNEFNQEIQPSSVIHMSVLQTVITFATPTRGIARLV